MRQKASLPSLLNCVIFLDLVQASGNALTNVTPTCSLTKNALHLYVGVCVHVHVHVCAHACVQCHVHAFSRHIRIIGE